MSVLPPDVHNELTQLLDALQSSDNGVRSQAEDHLANNWTTTKPEMLLMGLVEQIQASNDPTVRDLELLHYFHLLILCDAPDSFICSRHLPPNRIESA